MKMSEYYTKLIIYRSRQLTLMMLVAGTTIGFTMMILKGLDQGLDWWHLAAPLAAIGSLFIFYPSTEAWEYKPWQGRPRKVEQNFDR